MIAEILFPVALDRTFTYSIPQQLEDKIKPGIRIYASFSNRKKVLGYIISVRQETGENFDYELKNIDKIIDENPVFIFEKFIEISEYISKRWYSPKGLVLASFLRYLPLRFKAVESKSKIELNKINFSISNFILPNEDILYLASSSDKIKNILFSFLNKNKNVVLFFPHIFALEIFKRNLLNYLKAEDLKSYSSSIKTSQKKEIVTLLVRNEIKLLLTTKSGVFLPFNPDTVFMVIDPLNYMYRQFDQHPYYETIELIEKVAKVYNNQIIYISHAESVNFKLKKIKTIGEFLPLNDIKIIDIKKNDIFSKESTEYIRQIIDRNKKVLIVSYSKYIAGLVYCPNCKWIKKCPLCYHTMRVIEDRGNRNYECVYCNHRESYSNICPQCGSILQSKGYGSQRIYDNFKNLFPGKKILEIDGRIIHSSFLFEEKLSQLIKKDIDILIGTEIILNSVLDLKFDLIMMLAHESHQNYDYAYFERFIDKIKIANDFLNPQGEFWIYTFNPQNYIFENLNNMENVIKNEIELRNKFYYPPFCYLYEIEILSKNKDNLRNSVNLLIERMNESFKEDYGIIEFNYKHKVKKIRNQKFYRHKSYLKIKEYSKFFEFLKEFSLKNKLLIDIKSL